VVPAADGFDGRLPRFEKAEEWQEWFDRGPLIREKAIDLFEELATARTGSDPEPQPARAGQSGGVALPALRGAMVTALPAGIWD